jgi:hypothetical protein
VDAPPVVGTGADETVSIELNFNAFADDTPPTQHARRVARVTDPSVQDFADQILELATLRMELKRLTRECDALRHAVRQRDVRLQSLQEKLRQTRGAGSDAVAEPPFAGGAIARNGVSRDELSHTLDLLLANSDVTGAAAPAEEGATVTLPLLAPIAAAEPQSSPDLPQRRLVPVGHEGEPIVLSRDIMTIGRARDRDICISSKAVSRDHARLVMSARSVTVFDMDSENGCFVNDERVKRQRLRENDVLRIGDRSYRLSG